MILFSRNRIPLAVVMVRLLNDGINPQIPVHITKPSQSKVFLACIIPSRCRYEIVITNLTEAGLKIDLLKQNKSVNMIDPGPGVGLNQINELRPLESFPIRGDQQSDRVLNLEHPHKHSYYIAVTPTKDNAKYFDDPYWNTADFFCVAISNSTPKPEVWPLVQIAVGDNNKINARPQSSYQLVPPCPSSQSENTEKYIYDVPTNLDDNLVKLRINTCLRYRPSVLQESEVKETSILMFNELKTTKLIADMTTYGDFDECVICWDDTEKIDVTIVPCGHKCGHSKCLSKLQKCPICMKEIQMLHLEF
jgi:hypothetical protein